MKPVALERNLVVLLLTLGVTTAAPACRRTGPSPASPDELVTDIRLPTCRLMDPTDQDKPAILYHSERIATDDTPNWIVVSADQLLPVARRWATYRAQSGYHTQVISLSQILGGRNLVADRFVQVLRRRLVQEFGTSHPEGLRYLLLLGDSQDTDIHPEVRTDLVPTLSYQGEFLTDLPYADLNDDGLPDLALGRIPVRTLAQAEAVLAKTIRYEQGGEPGPWRHRLILFASEGDFGPFVDALMERVGLDLLSALPEQWNITFVHARAGSAYGLPPHQYTKTLLALLARGSLAAVYTGHGYLDSLEDVTWGPDNEAPILDIPDIEGLDCGSHCPVMILAACHTGDFGHGESFAEAIARNPTGPPGVVAATDISHPFPNAMLAFKLIRLISKRAVSTLGHAFLEAILTLGQPETMAEQRMDRLVTLVWSQEELRDILEENRRMYVLLADPALKLALSHATIHLGVHQLTGRKILVCGRVDGIDTGQVTIALLRPRLTLPRNLDTSRVPKDSAGALVRWRHANHRILQEETTTLEEGSFSATVTLPSGQEKTGIVVRALVVGAEDDAAAALDVLEPSQREQFAGAQR